MFLEVTLDVQTLLLAGAIMGVIVTSRPFVRAVAEWGVALYHAFKWIRRRTLDELYRRVRSLEEWKDEHDSDVEAHYREPFEPRE